MQEKRRPPRLPLGASKLSIAQRALRGDQRSDQVTVSATTRLLGSNKQPRFVADTPRVTRDYAADRITVPGAMDKFRDRYTEINTTLTKTCWPARPPAAEDQS